ncbi:MAG: hypothetical protein IAE78_21365 [Myxococcus sp.]|nr:hypothetical protein [Myxococcus sp.]
MKLRVGEPAPPPGPHEAIAPRRGATVTRAAFSRELASAKASEATGQPTFSRRSTGTAPQPPGRVEEVVGAEQASSKRTPGLVRQLRGQPTANDDAGTSSGAKADVAERKHAEVARGPGSSLDAEAVSAFEVVEPRQAPLTHGVGPSNHVEGFTHEVATRDDDSLSSPSPALEEASSQAAQAEARPSAPAHPQLPRQAPPAASASPASPMVTRSIGTAAMDLKGGAASSESAGGAKTLDLLAPPAVHAQDSKRAAAPTRNTDRSSGDSRGEREPARDDRLTAAAPVAPAPSAPPAPAPELRSRPAEPVGAAAPPPLPNVAPALLEDPSLRVVVLPNIARVHVETSDGGSLSLQVKVHDGVTDIRAAGSAALLVDARQAELRLALAHEGLKMGTFDLTQSDSGSRHHQPHAPAEPPAPPRRAAPPPSPSTAPLLRADGRLSVKA